MIWRIIERKSRCLTLLLSLIILTCLLKADAQNQNQKRKVIAFFTAKNDAAHISFVHEANKWFSEMSLQHRFQYDSTTDWNNLNDSFLLQYSAVLFLDTRPETAAQRTAFKTYMEHGGAWMGFHFSGFALTPSDFPENWDWYHNDFIGAGEYKGNTWRPTAATLKVEDHTFPATKNLPDSFRSAPNEWYSWQKNLRKNPNIQILLSIAPSSFPLGTGPKLYEIWHSGDYPVAWTNKNYRMIYMNMGHNDMDYEHKTNAQLSSTFSSEMQNRFIIDALLGLIKNEKVQRK